MRIPQTPPSLSDLLPRLLEKRSREELPLLLERLATAGAERRYLHWDQLRHRTAPEGLSHQEWWLGIKLRRKSLAKSIALTDVKGAPFSFLEPDPIPELLHHTSAGAGGVVEVPEPITNPDTRDRYHVRSLIAEAITSSQLEGASTTRRVAKEMIRTGRRPQDASEQMILNNFRTMKRIVELKREPLTPELVLEIHRWVTLDTLGEEGAAGRLRSETEDVKVIDKGDETVLHVPPPCASLAGRMEQMCAFANGETPGYFVHPAIRSIILHFWLAHDHPFVDGNGRTARALFYWSMLRHKFRLAEYVSISEIMVEAPAKYSRAFLHTETDENDLTYFIIYHLEVLQRAIRELHEYIERKSGELRRLEAELRGVSVLNLRQRALVAHAIRHPGHRYTIASHRVSHDVAYQTARLDLLDLQERGLFTAEKVGKTWHFSPVSGLAERIRGLT